MSGNTDTPSGGCGYDVGTRVQKCVWKCQREQARAKEGKRVHPGISRLLRSHLLQSGPAHTLFHMCCKPTPLISIYMEVSPSCPTRSTPQPNQHTLLSACLPSALTDPQTPLMHAQWRVLQISDEAYSDGGNGTPEAGCSEHVPWGGAQERLLRLTDEGDAEAVDTLLAAASFAPSHLRAASFRAVLAGQPGVAVLLVRRTRELPMWSPNEVGRRGWPML